MRESFSQGGSSPRVAGDPAVEARKPAAAPLRPELVAAARAPGAGIRAGEAATPRPYWLFATHLWTVFGIALSNILLGLSILSAPLAGRSGRAVAGLRGAWPVLAATGAYLLFLLVSVSASLDPERSTRALTEFFNLAVIPLALWLVRSERDARRIVDGLVLLGGCLGVYGVAQFFLGYDHLHQRIPGPFSHYMTFSGVLLLADLLLVAQLVASAPRRRGWSGAWRWGALAAINAALLCSYTRSAWVALVAALTLLVLIRAPRWLLAYPVAAVVLALLAPAPMVDRMRSITDLDDPSNRDRLSMAQAGLTMVADRPLVGLGPEMVRDLYPRYRVETAVRDRVPHLHNSFLHLAAERGLPELASYLALMGVALAGAWRRFRREGGFRGGRADLYVGAALALVAFNVAGLFEHNWGDTEVQRLVLFLLALPWALPEGAPEG
ncbi:MAG: O-antigen ligase family protein [Thermoanaerobaculia bacterium]